MATGMKNQLTGQIGEHLVTAELGRRGIIATPFAGNVPDIDILAYANGVTGHIQVKAMRKSSWQMNIKRFLEIEITKKEQRSRGKNLDLDRKIICVFVELGPALGQDTFYIFTQGWLQDYFSENYKGRKPPNNIEATHCAVWPKHLQRHKENWDLIERKFKVR